MVKHTTVIVCMSLLAILVGLMIANAMAQEGCIVPTVIENVEFPEGWISNLEWDPNNPETINPDDEAVISVIGGTGPFTWSVEGNGFSLEAGETSERDNILQADESASGSATITVVDENWNIVVGYTRCTAGKWVLIEEYCCYDGSIIQPCQGGRLPETDVGLEALTIIGKYGYRPGYSFYSNYCPKSSYPYEALCYSNVPPLNNIIPCSESLLEIWDYLRLSGYSVYEWQCE